VKQLSGRNKEMGEVGWVWGGFCVGWILCGVSSVWGEFCVGAVAQQGDLRFANGPRCVLMQRVAAARGLAAGRFVWAVECGCWDGFVRGRS